MAVSREEYSRWYIVQALFKLMREYKYETIAVTDIVRKAGVGRATFYRYFKTKEDVIAYYFEHYTREFVFSQHFRPRCKEDYAQTVKEILTFFKSQREPFVLLRRARLEYLYLDYLNKNFAATFARDYPDANEYAPYLYAGMLFNVSVKWLDDGCAAPEDEIARTIVDAIYP